MTGANLGQPLGIADAQRRGGEALAATPARRASGGLARGAPEGRSTPRSIRTSSSTAWSAVTTPWTVENGFVTPTMKVKRNRIEEVYGAMYERWTGERKRVLWHLG